MKWIDKLERKFGRYGIPNLTVYVIACYVLGYLLLYLNPSVLSMLSLDVSQILRGQIWRLVTWVIYPPSSENLLFFCDYYSVFLLSHWDLPGTYMGNFPVYAVYFFGNFLYSDRCVSAVYCDRRCGGTGRIPRCSGRKHF